MAKLKGTKTETREIEVEVSDEELIRAIEERTGLSHRTLNKNETEIGYWHCDDGGGYFEHESDEWKCVSKDKQKIKMLKSIQNIEKYLKEEEFKERCEFVDHLQCYTIICRSGCNCKCGREISNNSHYNCDIKETL